MIMFASVMLTDGKTLTHKKSLNIIKRHNFGFQDFVVCWNAIATAENEYEWDWGTYCDTYDEALMYLRMKLQEQE